MTDEPDPNSSSSGPELNQFPGGSPGGSGLPENVAGALSYLLGPITGVAFFIIDRPRAFVRFHAVQSIAVCIAWVVLAVIFMVLSAILGFIPILGWLVSLLLSLGLSLAGFLLWLWLMLQAYQGHEWEVPGLGPHVRRVVADTGGGSPPPASGS